MSQINLSPNVDIGRYSSADLMGVSYDHWGELGRLFAVMSTRSPDSGLVIELERNALDKALNFCWVGGVQRDCSFRPTWRVT